MESYLTVKSHHLYCTILAGQTQKCLNVISEEVWGGLFLNFSYIISIGHYLSINTCSSLIGLYVSIIMQIRTFKCL